MTYHKILLLLYTAVLAIFSFLAFLAFGKDKNLSRKENEKRIKEKTLLFLTVFGGGIGAFFGASYFRHKTKKIYFSITIYISMILQIAVWLVAFATAY